ncbi:MAG: hypothetical protein C0622_01550 [Desulfuromonas sp.]|nr:MAG: hypothetical protein C0622_01550 [Desulfuromonas sp.]
MESPNKKRDRPAKKIMDNERNAGGSGMSEDQVEKYLERLKKRQRALVNNPKKVTEILISSGIYNEEGELTENYR